MSSLDRRADGPQGYIWSAMVFGFAMTSFGTLCSMMASLKEDPGGDDMSRIGLCLPFLEMTKIGFVLRLSKGELSKGPATKPLLSQVAIESARCIQSSLDIGGLGAVSWGSFCSSTSVSAPNVRSLIT